MHVCEAYDDMEQTDSPRSAGWVPMGFVGISIPPNQPCHLSTRDGVVDVAYSSYTISGSTLLRSDLATLVCLSAHFPDTGSHSLGGSDNVARCPLLARPCTACGEVQVSKSTMLCARSLLYGKQGSNVCIDLADRANVSDSHRKHSCRTFGAVSSLRSRRPACHAVCP